MSKVYVTFGQVHSHVINNTTFDKDCVAVIECQNYDDGRSKAFEYFGKQFFTTYSESEFTNDMLRYFPRGFIKV